MTCLSCCRGGKAKARQGGGKHKNGQPMMSKKEGYDLIVHIDLLKWKLSDDLVSYGENKYNIDFILLP